MSDSIHADTPAARILRTAGIQYTDHYYTYEEGGGTAACAQQLGVDEHSVIKTIILNADGSPIMVLMHGDMRASAKELARIAGAEKVLPCSPQTAEEITGYQTGGISPFGSRTFLPLYMEESVLNLRKIFINGGRQGFMLGMDPYDLLKLLKPVLVRVGSARAA